MLYLRWENDLKEAENTMNRRNSEFAGRHPVVITVYILLCVIWTMVTRHPVALLLSFLSSAFYLVVIKGIRSWGKVICSGSVMLFLAAVILPLFSHRGVTPIFYVNGMAVTWESVFYGMMMTLMLLAVLQWCMVAGCLLDSEKILYLTGKIIPTIGLLLMMIFRALPHMQTRYRQIHEAQAGLGRNGDEVSLWQRTQNIVRELSVLISWSLEDSVEVSMSMESRGYGSGKRTWFHLFQMQKEDLIWCIYLVLMSAGIYICQFQGRLQAYYFPEIFSSCISGNVWMILLAGTCGMITPCMYDLYYRFRDIRRSVLEMGQRK